MQASKEVTRAPALADPADFPRRLAVRGKAIGRRALAEVASLVTPDPIDGFLFETRRGFCEHFATSMVLMLRSVGIPARLVTGFKGGDSNAYGDYIIVRQRNAHSWVEALIDGRWRRFDPTPVAVASTSAASLAMDSIRMYWYRYVVGYDSFDQQVLAGSIWTTLAGSRPDISGMGRFKSSPLVIAIFAIIAGFGFVRVFKLLRARGRLSPESRAYMAFTRKLRRRGCEVGPSSTATEVLAEAVAMAGSENKDDMAEVLGIYERARFGGVGLNSIDMQRLRRLGSALK